MAARTGRGFFTKQIRRMQANFNKKAEEVAVARASGAYLVPKHEKLRPRCPRCNKFHSINEHRFHGPDAHLRTHGETSGGTTAERSKAATGKLSAKELRILALAQMGEKATTATKKYGRSAEAKQIRAALKAEKPMTKKQQAEFDAAMAEWAPRGAKRR